MKTTLTIILIASHISLVAQRDSLRSYYQSGVAAYEAQHFSSYLEYFKKANVIRPNHPTITYNLASAYALNQKEKECLDVLKQMVAMNYNILEKIETDSDFSKIIDHGGYAEIQNYASKVSALVQNSRLKYSVAVDSSHIEAITYNPLKDSYYLGAVNSRSLFELKDSQLREIISYEANENIYSILGSQFNTSSNSVWFCTTVLPQMEEYVDSLKGYSSVIEYDLEREKIITEVTVKGGSAFGDLILDKEGQVFISDGLGNKIYTLKSGESKLSVFADLSASLFNLQGLCLSKNEKFIFVSDYISGIYRINTVDKSFVKIPFPDEVSEKGIDGLYFHNESLLAVQNGTTPYRIIQLNLNSKLSEVKSYKILDQARKELNEPTQGVLVNGDFIYIANSPWGNYNDNNKIATSEDLLLLSSGLKK